MFVVISISMHKTKPEGIGVTTLTSPMGIQENNLLGEIKGIYGVRCWSLQKKHLLAPKVLYTSLNPGITIHPTIHPVHL